MKVFLADNYSIKDYFLPSKVEDQFLITYTSINGIDETLTLTAEDSKWSISSGADRTISRDTIQVTKESLVTDSMYTIKFTDLDYYVYLYVFETPIEFKDYAIGNKTTIQLGNSNSCDIIYNNPYTSSPHFKIYLYNGYWIIEAAATNDQYVFFVNKKRVFKKVLRLGDVIFVNGLKLIWMDTFIRINNPNNSVQTSLSEYQEFGSKAENTYTPVKETERNIVLYNDNQVFFHTPRLTKNIVPIEISIENPPPKIEEEERPMILTYGATIMMGISSSITGVIAIFSAIKGNGSILTTISEIVICIVMLFGSLFFPTITEKYRKKTIIKKEKKRQQRYQEYLNRKVGQIQEELKKESSILFEKNLNVDELKKGIIEKNNNVWSREIKDEDFLNLRVGLGNKASEITILATLEDFSMEDDNLRDKVREIKETPLNLNNVPMVISLLEDNVFPIVITPDFQYRKYYIDWLMLQIMTYYSGLDLKIAILTTEENKKEWEYLKYLPHLYSTDRSIRLFATEEDEYKIISQYLEGEFSSRVIKREENDNELKSDDEIKIENRYKNYDQYYLIITDNYVDVKRLGIIDKILDSEINIGFSLLTLEKSMSSIPSRCNKFIEINSRGCTIYNKSESNKVPLVFKPEYFVDDIESYARILANIPVVASSLATSLPSSLNFLEMYKVGRIEQLNIVNRWEHNDPTISLHTPLGIRSDGKLLELDLHEKYHGPHGLIAGSTGSGKSEFIITFILSMAINYHPYEVQFVLIDYKGGGLAGAFENRETGQKLPHLVGTITNLDTNEMTRTLVSINSELKRRQRKFNEARDALGESTVDIYKYQKFYREGKVKEPISHLFIISDEFAELKAQQPDFMDELVSTARIGRSLGVHLILATQKPAGVVDDQIWSNSKFKICLKVATTEDSREMLGRNEAAYIKETGRFYLQVGNNELFELGQSGWSGARYLPRDYIEKTIDDSVEFIDNNANIIQKLEGVVKQEHTDSQGDQLTNIVKTLYSLANREEIKMSQLWLPSIPADIYLSDIINKYKFKGKKNVIETIIGEYDNPTAQTQNILTLDLTQNGNTVIYGNAGSGKENMLITMLYSLCVMHTTEELNIYIMDFGSEVLKVLNELPQVGDVALTDEKDKIKSLLMMLDRELIKRKGLFSEYNGSYSTYIAKSGKQLPFIVVVLNGYESMVENNPEYIDFMIHLLREGSKYGIIFITTASAVNSIGSSISRNYNYQIATQLKDDFDYKFTFNAPLGLTPAKFFGRGIITIDSIGYEFQTAYISNKDLINETIKATADKLVNRLSKAPRIPVIPMKVNSSTLAKYVTDLKSVPVGINAFTADVSSIDLEENKLYKITGNDVLYRNHFIFNLINVLDSISNTKVRIINFANIMIENEGIDVFTGEFTKVITGLVEEDKKSKAHNINVIMGIGKIHDTVLDEGIEKLFNMFNNINNCKNSNFILIDNFQSFKRITQEEWYKNNTKENTGIWVGEDIDIQTIITMNNLTSNEVNAQVSGLLYNIVDGNIDVVKGLGVNGDGEY